MQTQINRALVALASATIVAWPSGLARAQPPSGGDTVVSPVDTLTAAQGSDAGRIAARQPDVLGRAMLGFVSGLPIGFSVPSLAYGGIAGVALGVAGIEAAGRIGDTSPPSSSGIQERGGAFRAAYIKSYRTTLGQRQRGAARNGGVLGSIAGFGLLYFLITHMTT
jgi:hypothetical protein